MNPTQLAFRQSIIGVRKPRIIQYAAFGAASTAVTVTIPRSPGKLCIVFAIHKRGTSAGSDTPGVLTGFTSIATFAAGNNQSGVQVQYKFLNGSEAATLSSSMINGTNAVAVVVLIEGAISNRVPNGSVSTNSNSSITPPSVTATSPFQGNNLWLVLASNDTGGTTATDYPAGFRAPTIWTSTTQFPTWLAAENINQGTVSPSSFNFSSNNFCCAATVCVRGP